MFVQTGRVRTCTVCGAQFQIIEGSVAEKTESPILGFFQVLFRVVLIMVAIVVIGIGVLFAGCAILLGGIH